MKVSNSIIFIVLLFSCSENSYQAEVKNADGGITKDRIENVTPLLNEKLFGTWYVKEILVDGKPDPENYPVNNDEFTLNEDMSVVSVDKTYDIEDKGRWEWVSDNFIMVETEEDKVMFHILKLTDTELETRVIVDGAKLLVKYKKSK